VRFDNNKYSVTASAVGRPVAVHAYADRIVIRQDGRIVAEHARSFGRGDTIYDPWHYAQVLARKPGALRNGAPFKDWVLPAAIERVRRKLVGAGDVNRQMVDILNAVLTDGLPAVEAACAEAIAHGVHSADVVLNILARQRDPAPPATLAALGRKHGASAAQVAIAWLLDQEGVIAIPKAGRPEGQQANLDALGISLDMKDRAAIAALPKDQRFVRPPFAPEWDSVA
jgi:hypothetical protein